MWNHVKGFKAEATQIFWWMVWTFTFSVENCRWSPNAHLRKSWVLSLSLSLHVQTSMNRKQAENVAKKKLDNLMKESKIRDREDPDSFTITSLPPSAKPHEKSTVKVQTSLFCFSSFIYIHLKQLPKFIGWFKLVSRSGFWFNRWSSLKFYVTESSPREWLFCMYNAVKLCIDVWNKTS